MIATIVPHIYEVELIQVGNLRRNNGKKIETFYNELFRTSTLLIVS